MNEDKQIVFVYGTLKKGYSNHHLLKTSEFLGPAKSVSRWRMKMLGFPALIKGPMVGHIDKFGYVRGELYSVNAGVFARLDSLEGYDTLYTRSVFPFVMNEKSIDAWIYHASPGMQRRIVDHTDILPIDGCLIWPPRKESFATQSLTD